MPRPRARGGGLSVAGPRFCIVNMALTVDGFGKDLDGEDRIHPYITVLAILCDLLPTI